MKNYLFCLPILFALVSCDAPRRTLSAGNYSSGVLDPGTGFSTGSAGGGSTGSSGGTSGGSTTTPGFESCDLSLKYSTVDIGQFGLCQSSSDETVFKIVTAAEHSVQICLIPTYKNASGASTYLGNPQCTTTKANTVLNGKLYKERSGFTHLPINGVIVMKLPLTTGYFGCMQASAKWLLNLCPQGRTTDYCSYWIYNCPNGINTGTQMCVNEANNYMNNVCTQFKNQYSSAYADIRTKN